MIRLEALRRVHGYGQAATVALDGVTLTIETGEFVAVAGPSGSGKTTLLNLIGAIDRPTSGTVWLEDRDLSRLDAGALAAIRLERIGYVFQHFSLIPVLTAQENVELPLLFRRGLGAGPRRENASRALENVGLEGRQNRRPGELSGGERQRVAVARALAGDPAIILADEPTANLDHETGSSVIGLMHAINRERRTTFLYATHDQELIRLADRVVNLRDGRVVEKPS